MQLNIFLHFSYRYIASGDNSADVSSRHLSIVDSKLHPEIWNLVQREFDDIRLQCDK